MSIARIERKKDWKVGHFGANLTSREIWSFRKEMKLLSKEHDQNGVFFDVVASRVKMIERKRFCDARVLNLSTGKLPPCRVDHDKMRK